MSSHVGMLVHKPGSAVKAVPRGNGLVEGYIIAWGNPSDADLEGQYFTKDTDLRLEYFRDYPMLYHHGMDAQVGLDPIGRIKSVQKDDIGLWGQAQCDLANEYGQEVYNRVQQSKFGWSSGSIDHLVKVAQDGHILVWPLFEGSITPTPAQPHKTTVRALKSILLPDDPVAKYLRDLETSKEVARSAARKTFDMGANTMPTSMKAEIARTMKKYGYKVDPAVVDAVAADLEEEAALSEDEALMSDDEFDPAMMGEFEDDAALADDEFDPAMMGEFEDEALMSDDEFDPAMMGEFEDDAMMFEEEDPAPVMSSRKMQRTQKTQRRTATQKAIDPTMKALIKTVNDLAVTVKSLKETPAPGQKTRGIKGMQYAEPIDHRGNKKAYKSVFERALRFGEGKLTDTEKNILYTKQDDFNSGAVTIKGLDGKVSAIKAYNTTNAGNMGFGVPEDFLDRLNQNIAVTAQTLAECQKYSTSSDVVKFPSVNTTDGRRAFPGRVSWVGEQPSGASASSTTEASLNQEAIPVHIMMVSATATYSALEDVQFDLSKFISDQFAEAVSVEYEELIMKGNGQNKLAGITTDTRVTGSASTGVSSVGGYVASGDATTLTNADPLKSIQMHLPPGYRPKAKWYMNSQTVNAISQLRDGMGRYLWGDEQGLNQGVPTTLLGRPIVVNEYMDDIGADTFPIIYGDMYRGYMVVNRVDFSIRRFDDATYAAQDLAFFIGRARVGGQVIAPYAYKALKIAAS